MVSILSQIASDLREGFKPRAEQSADYRRRTEDTKAKIAAAKKKPTGITTSGGSGFRGSDAVAAAENVTDFQRAQAMQFLGNVDSLEGVEARVGRKDGDHILYVNGETAGRFEGGSGVKQRNRIAGIINCHGG
jgi:NAD(P)H-dependent FMN reductase